MYEAEAPSNYLPHDELRKLAAANYTPIFVFLDSAGKKVLETRGFRTPREAKARRLYLKTQWPAFLAAYPKV